MYDGLDVANGRKVLGQTFAIQSKCLELCRLPVDSAELDKLVAQIGEEIISRLKGAGSTCVITRAKPAAAQLSHVLDQAVVGVEVCDVLLAKSV